MFRQSTELLGLAIGPSVEINTRRIGAAYADFPAPIILALAGFLFATVFVVRILETRPMYGVHLFYMLPTIILALRFGVRGGLIAALLANLLFVTGNLIDGAGLQPSTWASPALTILIVGPLVGLLAQSLAESERRFRSAAENQLEPFALYASVRAKDGKIDDFRMEFINDAGAESVGLRPQDMQGKLLSELFPGRLEHAMMSEYAQVVETGEPVFREAVDYVNVLGEETLVRAFDIRVSKLEDGVQVTWRDITDRVLAERERDWLASIVEQASDAVLSIDNERRIVSWSQSAEELHGFEHAEVIGRELGFLAHEQSESELRTYFDRVLAGERPGPIVVREVCKDGQQVELTVVGWPIFDRDGCVIGAARSVRRAA